MTIINMTGGGASGPKIPLNDISTLSATDGENSDIILKRTDVGNLVVNGVTANTWASTKLVRKVGSAPSSSSDGTLVTTSTTLNQYQTNGYDDTGLTMGTTYYYKAFSVGSNGLESGSNSVSATATGRWQPGANTVLYLPLNGDSKDPYNNVTYTWGKGSASYATWSGSTQAANFTGSNAILIGTSLDYTGGNGECTVCFWFTTTSPSTEQRCSSNVSGKYFNMCRITSSKASIYCNNSLGQTAINGTTTLSANTKYLFTATFKSGGTIKLYLNGNLENSASIGTFQSLTSQFGQWIGCARDGSGQFRRGMIKDFIVEDKIWTDQEIADYYTRTV